MNKSTIDRLNWPTNLNIKTMSKWQYGHNKMFLAAQQSEY